MAASKDRMVEKTRIEPKGTTNFGSVHVWDLAAASGGVANMKTFA